MSVTARSLGASLVAIAGRERVLEDDGARQRFAVDGRAPRWVVRPASLEQAARVLALAHDEGLAVVPRGSGSALEQGGVPARVDVVLDLATLDRVVEYNPDDMTITVEAGCTVGALAARLAAHRQFLPLDPPGAAARTLGGIAATNASGPLRARYGTMRDLLLGVRFVQADGVLTWGGAKVVKSVSGYDVPKLMVAALGTLGVLGELTLRLHPVPDFEATWLAGFSDAAAAQAFIARLLDSTVQPSRVELLNAAALAACGIAGLAAGVAVSIGTVEAAVRAQGEVLHALGREAGTVAAARDGFWADHAKAMAPDGGVRLAVGTLASRLGDTVDEIERVVAETQPAARPTITGCGPLGSLRVWLPGTDARTVGAVVERLRAFVAPVQGSVVIQKAPAAVRAAVDPWGPIEPGPLALMRGLKDEFDPKRILNPGRFVGGL
jgi:glycolate oxidase FAD binding subunit